MKVTVSDVVSPSYFPLTAAVELGYFKEEGLEAELVHPPESSSEALRDGGIDFMGASPYVGFAAFPEWQGGRILCALSQGSYWFLAMRKDLNATRGNLDVVKGRRISAAGAPGMLLKRLLQVSGIDPERDVQIFRAPSLPGSWARVGAQAIQDGVADGYWGNAMRAEWGVRQGVASVLVDLRRGDGPDGARDWTFPALLTTDRLIEENPQAVAGATRATARAVRALRADPSLARQAAKRLFPAEETEIIAELMERDGPWLDPSVSQESVAKAMQFARDIGMLSAVIAYDRVVATQFSGAWAGND
jgi:ABC-type nitrate/sulfonate/bicarbonate transport system substrate-binding protein